MLAASSSFHDPKRTLTATGEMVDPHVPPGSRTTPHPTQNGVSPAGRYYPQKRRHRPGLAISKRIIEMHGGKTRVESGLGQGWTFSFTLPVNVGQQAAPA
jgi:sensor histidine kinase regulating citrate/malate metabolism